VFSWLIGSSSLFFVIYFVTQSTWRSKPATVPRARLSLPGSSSYLVMAFTRRLALRRDKHPSCPRSPRRNHRPSVEILTATGLCHVGRRADHRRSARRGGEQEQQSDAIVAVHIQFNGHKRRRVGRYLKYRPPGRYLFTVPQEIRRLAPLAAWLGS
jgi:hypothetical protein